MFILIKSFQVLPYFKDDDMKVVSSKSSASIYGYYFKTDIIFLYHPAICLSLPKKKRMDLLFIYQIFSFLFIYSFFYFLKHNYFILQMGKSNAFIINMLKAFLF